MPQKLRLIRFVDGTNSSMGLLMLGREFLGFVVEDEKRSVKVKGETRIPAGVYPLAFRNSVKFSAKLGHDMIWVKEVPNFEYIYIHPGNTEADTEGCFLVGNGALFRPATYDGELMGGTSLTAYKRIYARLAPMISSGELAEIEVYDSVEDIKNP